MRNCPLSAVKQKINLSESPLFTILHSCIVDNNKRFQSITNNMNG